MFEKIKQSDKFELYSLNISDVQVAEEKLGIRFPSDLVELYSKVGYGFMETQEFNVNRIMDPLSILEFRTVTGQFSTNNMTEYDNYEKDKLVFFEVNESLYLMIGFSKLNDGKIYYFDKEIATGLEEFFDKYSLDEKFFL